MSDWPNPPYAPKEKHAAAVSWFTKLLNACKRNSLKSITVTGGTATIKESSDGKHVVISVAGNRGNNNSSGTTLIDFYDSAKAYNPGAIVKVRTTGTVGLVTLTPGIYGCRKATVANAGGNVNTKNQVPQFPEPVADADVYWILMTLGLEQVNICQNGSKQIYIHASSAF